MIVVESDRPVVILTGTGIEHVYVAQRLLRVVPSATIIRASPKPRGLGTVAKYGVGETLRRVARKVYLGLIRDHKSRREAMEHVLGTVSPPPSGTRTINVDGVNGDASRRVLAEIDPGLVLVYGTSVIGRKTFDAARCLWLNMHTGLSPYYRGNSCAFWPIYDGRLELLGATIHECTPIIDGGRILATRRVLPVETDGIHEIFARCVQEGAEAYCEVVERVRAHGMDGIVQELSVGREFRARDKTVFREWKARRAVAAGVVRNFCQTYAASAGEPGKHA